MKNAGRPDLGIGTEQGPPISGEIGVSLTMFTGSLSQIGSQTDRQAPGEDHRHRREI